MLKTVRLIAWGTVAAIVLGLAAMAIFSPELIRGGGKAPFSASIGGPFALTGHDGSTVTDQTLRGRPYAIFFGFTNCPDVCPTSMLDLSETMKELGPDADKIRFLFVSVDHEHDTAAHLKEYLSNFDSRILGLTGSAEAVSQAARAYRVYYEKVKTTEGYTYNHTATIYLMDASGRLSGTLAYQEDPKTRLAKLKRLASG